ncbi:hypothetical protein LXL04_004088 [Taraxacum kok-saghyz]
MNAREQDESFKSLPLYLYNLKKTNTYSLTYVKLDGNGHFEKYFVSLGCVLHAFLTITLSVVFVGSAPLRGNCLSTMFTAFAVDGSRQPLPVAYGFWLRENVRSWTWFLTMLKECMRDARELCFPNSYRGYCCDNVSMILKSRCRPNATQVAISVVAFEHHYERLKNALPSQARWLDNIGHDKWARAYFPYIRFNVMVATIPDALSLLLLDEENVPITT